MKQCKNCEELETEITNFPCNSCYLQTQKTRSPLLPPTKSGYRNRFSPRKNPKDIGFYEAGRWTDEFTK